MTVAAVILSATLEGALADTLGQPRVRRLADLAWSGGALPIMVLSPDPDGAVAAALAGSEAVYGSPAPPEAGPAGQMVRGAELAMDEVHDTTAVLLWPARLTWVGPETITSLIETHGMDPARDAAAGLARRTRLAGPAADDATRRTPRRRAGPDAARRSSTTSRRPSRRGSSRWATRASSTMSTPRRATCRPTKGRPTRRPGTATSGAPTSPPRRASPSPSDGAAR